jgi:hypothetical protein
MTHTKSVEQATQVVADLIKKRDEVEARKVLLEHQRDEIAFDAHTGDEKARAKITKFNSELSEIENEIASFAAAIRTAETKVREAQGEQRAEIEREQARHAQKLGREMLDAATAADRALTQAFAALGDMRGVASELARIGCPPSPMLLESNLKRALITVSMSGGRFALGHLAASEKISMLELGQRWSEAIQHWAAQRLGDSVKEVEAA